MRSNESRYSFTGQQTPINSHLGMRMRKATRNALVMLSIAFILGGCYGSSSDVELPQATVDYARALPPTANIIEGKADAADFFGDYSMCAVFTLSESDLNELWQQKFDWFPDVKRSRTHNGDWVVGPLTEEQLEAVSWMLDNKPDPNATYSYIEERVDGGWMQHVAINTESSVVYYCKVSW